MDKGLTIQEVSRELNISKPTLRYWEKEFEDILVPLRTSGGQRRYDSRHLAVIEEIIDLKNRNISIAAIKNRLNGSDDYKIRNKDPKDIDELANRVAEVVRNEIHVFFNGALNKK